jgi:hypothetical protein
VTDVRKSGRDTRIVIRSVARTRVSGQVFGAAGAKLRYVRMAFNARADSMIPSDSATLTNRAFSSGEGRAVIEGTYEASARELTRGFPGSKGDKAMLIDCSRESPHPIACEAPN